MKRRSPPSPRPSTLPGVDRRRELRRQRQMERLRDGWRVLVYAALTAGLGFVLLREGWILQGPNQVEVSGSRVVNREQVIEAAKLKFPLPLLTLQPRLLRNNLADTLPVEQVRVTRLMLPPRLRVELVDREAIARAQRRTPNGPELGFVDRTGRWIHADPQTRMRLGGEASIRVVGWNERHLPVLAKVLEVREQIGPGLKEIRFEPDGSLWITTRDLGPVRLGPADSKLGRRLQVLIHLNRTLPARLAGKRPTSIDLTDPEQPELNLSLPTSTPASDPSNRRPASRRPYP